MRDAARPEMRKSGEKGNGTRSFQSVVPLLSRRPHENAREAVWSAVACYRFRSGQRARRRAVYRSWGSGAVSKLAG